MHDDRIAGVTFEENALRNALIVNEEYAWVGNPFSAPKEGRIRKVLPSFFCRPVHEGLGTCDLKTPLPGVGGVCQNSRTTRAARECESRFPLQNKREESKRFFPFCFVCRVMEDSAHATSKRPAKERDKNKRGDCAVQTRPAHNVRHVIRAKAQKQTFLSRDSPYLSQFYQISIPRLYLIEILHQTTTARHSYNQGNAVVSY